MRTRPPFEHLALAAAFALSLAGCGVGSVGGGDDDGNGGGGGGGGGADGSPSPRLCMAELSISGTFTQVADPPEGDGCVPNGTWDLELQLVDMADCQDVTFDQEGYSYEVSGDPNLGEEWEVTYLGDPADSTLYLDVKGQGGDCEGSFQHWSGDGQTLLLIKPYQQGNALSGSASYEEYSENQL